MLRTSAIRVSRLNLVRFTSSRVEGSVAQTQGFNKKEQAHENEYIHRKELERLQKMKLEVEQHKQQLEEITKSIDEQTAKANENLKK
ncbi:hypothetical protein C8J56DRAFT_192377 [Mycena floridula]|nr:hypothetical protein C8J56DRAFT_192377 [Mycena floridula]